MNRNGSEFTIINMPQSEAKSSAAQEEMGSTELGGARSIANPLVAGSSPARPTSEVYDVG